MKTAVLTEPRGETVWPVMESLLSRGMRLYVLSTPSSRLQALSDRFPEQLERLGREDGFLRLKGSGVQADMVVIDASRPPEEDFDRIEQAGDFDRFDGSYQAAVEPLPAGEKPGRICWITGKAGADGFCERMRCSALHMGIKLLFNALRPQGYTFRLICEMPEGEGNSYAAEYFLRARAGGDEDRLTLRSHLGRYLPW